MRPLPLVMFLLTMVLSAPAWAQAQGEAISATQPAVAPLAPVYMAPGIAPVAPEAPAPLAGTSDDADLAFVRGMMENHKRAISMAKEVLTKGVDPDLRMLAGDILKAQGQELEAMEKWMAAHGPRPVGTAPTKPRPPVMKAKPRPATGKPLGELLDDMENEAKPSAVPALPMAAAVSASAPEAAAGDAEVSATQPAAAVPPAPAAESEPATLFDDDMPMPLLEDMGADGEAAPEE